MTIKFHTPAVNYKQVIDLRIDALHKSIVNMIHQGEEFDPEEDYPCSNTEKRMHGTITQLSSMFPYAMVHKKLDIGQVIVLGRCYLLHNRTQYPDYKIVIRSVRKYLDYTLYVFHK